MNIEQLLEEYRDNDYYNLSKIENITKLCEEIERLNKENEQLKKELQILKMSEEEWLDKSLGVDKE